MTYIKNNKAFSLIEVSIILAIIAVLIAGVTQGSKLVNSSKLYVAQKLTKNSPVKSIDGLVLWLETTMLKDSFDEWVDPSSQTANKVATWRDLNPSTTDKSNATQSTLTAQPTLVNNIEKNLPVLRFNPVSSQFFNLPDGTVPYANSSYSVFIVAKTNIACHCGVIGSGNYGTANQTNAFRYDNVSGFYNYWWISNLYSGANKIKINKFEIIEITYNYATSLRYISIDGVQASSLTSSNNAATSSNNTIGKTWTSEYMNGDIAEIIIFNRALKPFEIRDVEFYLGRKWSIPVS